MTKKIIILLTTILCNNSIIAMLPEDTTIYSEFIKKYDQNRQLSTNEINEFLEEKKISIQNLYTILSKKISVLNQAGFEVYYSSMPQYRPGNISSWDKKSKSELAFLTGTLGFFISSPIVATGLAIKHYVTPSPVQKIISSGLIGSGAIIASISPILYGMDFISTKLSDLYESITHKKQNAQIKYQAISNEIDKIKDIMRYLESLYPELKNTPNNAS